MEKTILRKKDFRETPEGLTYEGDFKCEGHLEIETKEPVKFKVYQRRHFN